MKYVRSRYDGEDDVEYDYLIVFEKDYDGEKVENAFRELWNKSKMISVEEWLNHKGFKVKEMIRLNDIDVMYVK